MEWQDALREALLMTVKVSKSMQICHNPEGFRKFLVLATAPTLASLKGLQSPASAKCEDLLWRSGGVPSAAAAYDVSASSPSEDHSFDLL